MSTDRNRHTIEAQTRLIKRHLLEGRSITQMEALSLYGCMRLGARIYDLREQGLNIQTELIPWHGKNVARYALIDNHKKNT